MVAQAGQLHDRATAEASKVAELQTQADVYRGTWTPGVQLLLDSAKAKIDQGDLAGPSRCSIRPRTSPPRRRHQPADRRPLRRPLHRDGQ